MKKMTEEELKAWAKERADGVQFITPYGIVRCPSRKDQWVEKTTD